MNPTKTVHLVDDDEAVRDAISILLESLDYACSAYPDAQSFLSSISEQTMGCLVLDIKMPVMSGLELQERLIAQEQHIPIVFITGHGDVPMAVEAMKRGAVDFLRKPFKEEELLSVIDKALQVDQDQRTEQATIQSAQTLVDTLTPREKEIFDLVTEGQANKVIAIDLGISERTVEIHRRQAMQKTKSKSLADLVKIKLLTSSSAKTNT